MTSAQIEGRKDFLFDALINDSAYKEARRNGFLSIGERILINQERAYLWSLTSYNKDPNNLPLRYYSIPEELNKKIIKGYEQ